MKSDDLIKRIQKDIIKSGFPLEIRVSSILENGGWIVENQLYYRDEDTGKDRTVDIGAFKRFEGNFVDYDFFHVSLIVECKKSVKPWVFHVVQKKKRLFEIPFGLVKNTAQPKKTIKYSRFLEWMRHSHYYSSDLKEQAIIHYEPFKDGRGREIFEASNQVIKALNFELMRNAEIFPRTPKINPLCIFYPIIVFDGHLFACKIKDNEPKLSPVEYLQYLIHHRSPVQPLTTDVFLVDVVKVEYLQRYLNILSEEFDDIKHELEKP